MPGRKTIGDQRKELGIFCYKGYAPHVKQNSLIWRWTQISKKYIYHKLWESTKENFKKV